MQRRIIITCEHVADGMHMPRLRDLGEALYVKYRSGKEVIVDIHEVDRATDRLTLLVRHNRTFRTELREIEALVDEHFPDGIAAVSVEESES